MESHLLQMRGLKPQDKPCAQPLEKVASFTDAWIETKGNTIDAFTFRRIFYRCVD